MNTSDILWGCMGKRFFLLDISLKMFGTYIILMHIIVVVIIIFYHNHCHVNVVIVICNLGFLVTF